MNLTNVPHHLHHLFINNNQVVESQDMTLVKQNGYAIEYIENPSDEMKLAAVKQDGCAIKYIENPSDEIKLAAIEYFNKQ